jgi:hypothetical protein
MLIWKRKIQQQNITDYKNRMRGQNEQFSFSKIPFHSNNIPLLLLRAVYLLAFQRCKTTGQTKLGLQTGILYTSQGTYIAFLVAMGGWGSRRSLLFVLWELRVAWSLRNRRRSQVQKRVLKILLEDTEKTKDRKETSYTKESLCQGPFYWCEAVMEWVERDIGKGTNEYKSFTVNLKILLWGYLDDPGVVSRMTLIPLD